MQKLLVSLLQHDAGIDLAANLESLEERVLAERGRDLVCLPEIFAVRGAASHSRSAAVSIPGELSGRLGGWARKTGCWLLAGSVVESAGDRFYNTCLLFDRSGEITAAYRKMHLFEVDMKDGPRVREADVYTPGDAPVTAAIEGWRCGLSICYDLRFPELYRHYAEAGAELLLVPSDFMAATGRAHWEPLLRARAIENLAFVLAPNQCGTNRATGARSHGHSMIVDPWGRVTAAAGEEPETLRAELDPGELNLCRRRLPALDHRRKHLNTA